SQLPRGKSARVGWARRDRSRPLRGTFSASAMSPRCWEKPCRCTTTSTAAAAFGTAFQRRNRSGWVPACARNTGVSARYVSPGAKSNVIVYPTSSGAQHYDLEWLIAPGRALDPTKYFIVVINKFGNGLSSSPSNTPPPFDRGRYPHFTMADNVRVQQRLLSEVFGIERVKLVYGFSMGAQQAFHWGALFPDRVERIAPICGSAKTSPHNYVFLEGV